MNIHRFESTGDAYDACQCDEKIKDGDVLLIESEGVVGLAHTWPYAVTLNLGKLHGVKPDGLAWLDEPGHKEGYAEAVRLAAERNWPVGRCSEEQLELRDRLADERGWGEDCDNL